MHIHIHICIHVGIYVGVYIYICIYVYTYIHIHIIYTHQIFLIYTYIFNPGLPVSFLWNGQELDESCAASDWLPLIVGSSPVRDPVLRRFLGGKKFILGWQHESCWWVSPSHLLVYSFCMFFKLAYSQVVSFPFCFLIFVDPSLENSSRYLGTHLSSMEQIEDLNPKNQDLKMEQPHRTSFRCVLRWLIFPSEIGETRAQTTLVPPRSCGAWSP